MKTKILKQLVLDERDLVGKSLPSVGAGLGPAPGLLQPELGDTSEALAGLVPALLAGRAELPYKASSWSYQRQSQLPSDHTYCENSVPGVSYLCSCLHTSAHG